MKYHLIEGKNAETGTIIMTGDLAKIKKRKTQMKTSTRKSKYNCKKREFIIVEAGEDAEHYDRKPNTKWKNYNKQQPTVTKQKRQ